MPSADRTDHPVGTIRCLSCGTVFDVAPVGWRCTCGGLVSQKFGTIHTKRGDQCVDVRDLEAIDDALDW